MLPRIHIFWGFIFTLLILLFMPKVNIVGGVLIFLSSFLVDFDHYGHYVLKKKSLNLKKALNWYGNRHKKKLAELFERKNKPKKTKIFNIFHTVEFLIGVTIISLFFYPMIFILIGLLFHSIFDIIDLYIRGSLRFREYSTLLFLIRRNKNRYIYF